MEQKFGHTGSDSLSLNALITIGVLISVIGFGGFLLWGTTANLAKGVSAQGIVVVEGKRKTVQHLEGGIVKEIFVRDGVKVKAGDLLVQLDGTKTQAQSNLLSIRLNTTIATLDRLSAEQKQADKLEFSAEILAQADNLDVAQIINVQKTLFNVRKDQLSGQASILEQRIQQLNENIQGLKSQRTASSLQLGFLNDELKRSEQLVLRKIISLSDITIKKRDKAIIEGEIGRLTAEISAANVTQGEARLEILQLQKKFDQEVAQSILENREKIFELKSQIVTVDDVIKRLAILAPQDGTIIAMNVFTVGGVIPPASPILDIVPTEDNLVIDAKIGPVDIDNIYLKQAVRVRFSAFAMRSTPLVQGVVSNISPDIIVNPQTGESYYLAQIYIPEDELAKINENILPGMPTEILVETGSRTPLEYMLEPLEQTIERALNED